MPSLRPTHRAKGNSQRTSRHAGVFQSVPARQVGQEALREAETRLRFAAHRAQSPAAVVASRRNNVGAIAQAPAPDVPPGMLRVNANQLTWDYYPVVDGETEHSADTVRYLHAGYKSSAIATQGTKFINSGGGLYEARVSTRLTGLDVAALFDSNQSYVREGEKTATLLAHEKLHLQISQAIANRFEYYFKRLLGHGTHRDADQKKSLQLARDKADLELLAKAEDMTELFENLDVFITAWYDMETEHGTVASAQRDWARNWPHKVDGAIKALNLQR